MFFDNEQSNGLITNEFPLTKENYINFFFMGLAFLLFFSNASLAIDCTGKVDLVGTGIDGHLVARGPGGLQPIYLCNINTPVNGVSVEICKTWYSVMLAGFSSGSDVTVGINSSAACSSFSGWQYAQGVSWVFSRKN